MTRGDSPPEHHRARALRYLAVGGASYVVDAGLLWLLAVPGGVALALATTIAFAVSFVVNFTGNRLLVFPGGAAAHRQLPRYVTMVVLSYAITMVTVLGLTAAGVWLLAAKTVAVAVTAVLNYEAGRRWVYR